MYNTNDHCMLVEESIVTALSLTACETTSYRMELVLKPIRARFRRLVSRLWRAFVKDEHGSVESGRPRFQCVEQSNKNATAQNHVHAS